MPTKTTVETVETPFGNAVRKKVEVFDYQDRTRTRQEICVDAVEAAGFLIKELPGKWEITDKPKEREGYDCNVFRTCAIERKSDGLKLFLQCSTNYGREAKLEVSLASYKTAQDSYIDVRYLRREAGAPEHARPEARVSLTRPVKTVAKDITRRVIVPAEQLLTLIRERQQSDQKREDGRQATIQALNKLGLDVRGAEAGREAVAYMMNGPSLRVQSDGSVRIEYFYLDAKDLAAFVKFIRKAKG